jgi:arylsulfatase A-like enzyme
LTDELLFPELLRDYGNYINYGIGKWHLGHSSSNMLPTARGFHQWFGYTTGEMYYWSKKVPLYTKFTDMIYMNATCYAPYNQSDYQDYSTFLFRDKAIQVIQQHNYTEHPMFLYVAFQAVHVPYTDLTSYQDGIPSSYFEEGIYDMVANQLNVSSSRFQYSLSLMLLDTAVQTMVQSLTHMGQFDNTIFIFVSDNGACTVSGGRNGLLRGAKGTLFEGNIYTKHKFIILKSLFYMIYIYYILYI